MKILLRNLSTYFLLSFFLFSSLLFGLTESEPNGSIATANFTVEDSVMVGSIGNADPSDYFVTYPGDDGTIDIYVNFSTILATNDLFVYVYNKNGGQIANKYIYNPGIGSHADSVTVYCRSQDTFYIRISSTGAFNYLLHYTTTASGTSDAEPNDALVDAEYFAFSDTAKGRIGYISTSPDNNDYFFTDLPTFGTLRYIVEITNTSGSSSSDFFTYIYNKNGGQIGNSYRYDLSDSSVVYDTITIHCRELDTVYFRISSSGCFSYKFHYDVFAPTLNDPEPNNAFVDAVFFAATDTAQGRIGSISTSTDLNDYFYTVLPDDGTLKYYVEYYNTSGLPSSDFFTYVYNKSNGQIGSSFQYDEPLGLGYDTITIHCRKADTVYFRISSSGCFSYSFHFEVLPSGTADIEPNDGNSDANYFTFQDTVRGRIGYASISIDNNDYFYTVLPDDGTLKYYVAYNNTSGSPSSDFFTYVYNKSNGQIGSSFQYNEPPGLGYDTITIHCRKADTVFIRIGSTGCFSYDFYMDVIVSGTADIEPNDGSSDANYFAFQDTVGGRIGYASTSVDNNDYFYTVLPDDGTLKYYVAYNNTSGSSSSDFFTYVYNKSNGQIGSSYQYDEPPGLSYDTITIYCREADTVFIRISSTGCFSYDFSLDVISSGTTDAEPNNTQATAVPISLADTLSGRIGHTSTATDNNDYFSFTTAGTINITAVIKSNNTSNSANSDVFYYLYNSSGGLVWSKYFYDSQIGLRKDTSVMSCLPQDTYFLRVSSSGCFSYEMEFDTEDQQPVAEIKYSRYGNEFAFMSETGVTDAVLWDFDDSTSSTLFYPQKAFGIGVFDVVLQAFNSTCNIFDTDTQQVTINGIEYYTPKRAGTSDSIGFFNVRIFGGGLDTGAVVELTQGGSTVKPFQVGSPDGTELNVLFDFKDFDAHGVYDFRVTLSTGDSYSFPKGFEIFQDTPGFDIKTTVLGPDRIRTNRWTSYQLVVDNDRARIANGVMIGIVLPRYVEPNFYSIFLKKTGNYTIKGDEWDKLEIDFNDFNNTYFQGNFNPVIDTVQIAYDSIYTAIDSINLGIDIDSLYGSPINGTFYPIYIPMVPSESSVTIDFKLKSSQNSNSAFVHSYAWPFNFRDNPPSGESLEWIHEGGMQAAALAELAPNPALRFVGKNAGKIDIGSKVVFTEFFDWYYDANNANAEFYAEVGVDVAFEVGGELIPFGKNGDKAKESAGRYRKRMKNQTENLQMLESIAKNGKMHPNMAKKVSDRIQQYRDKIEQLGEFATDKEKIAAMEELKSYLSGRGMDLTNKQLKELLLPKKTKTNKPKHSKKKPVRSVTSLDPNAIYGNYGPTSKNYISKKEQLNYLVTFENVDTALAPAQIVKVNLQLDPSVFDVKRTTLGNIAISGKPYGFEQDRSQYFTNIDLRPEKQIIVRVNANIDTLTGFMEWQFTSLEPSTGELLIDPLDGFLPPNVNFPEGEGSVSFITFLKASVQNEDSIGAQAKIYFDENDPILTNTYSNFIDEEDPVSGLNATINVVDDTIMELSYSGMDAGSGIKEYYLKARVNNEDWLGADFPLDGSGTATVTGSQGNTYSFYLFAQDSVGNREEKAATAEAEITLQAYESSWDPSFELFPNPTQGDINIRSNGNYANTEIRVYNIFAQLVYTTTLNFTTNTAKQIILPRLSGGGYFVHFKTDSGKTDSQKLLLLR